MESKKCLYCNDEIIGKREDAKFCSNTCKAKHWEEKKLSSQDAQPIKEEKNVASQLRGVLNGAENTKTVSETSNSIEPVFKMVEQKVPNLVRIPIDKEYRRLSDVRKQVDNEIQELQAKLKQINSLNGSGWIWGLTGAGAIVGNKAAKKKDHGTVLGATLGLITGIIIQDVTKSSRDEEKKWQAKQLQQELQIRITFIQDADSQLKFLNDKLKLIPQYHIVQKQVKVIALKKAEENKPSLLPPINIENSKPLLGLNNDVSAVSLTTINSDKIISSQHLKKMEFKALNFQGKWNTLFGFPSINFHCVIHGMSGEGKSTFAIQFAKYLADSFGRVIYISGEEGFSKTFKDKFSNNNAESKFLDVADLRTFEDINREVPPESYNFIFIDSLDNMKIDADKMKKIRERYKNSALITISQSTKDGKMRGSYEIVHDCDIAVKVENGVASTTKNRFKEKGMSLNVFEDKKLGNNIEIKRIV
ncbi:MAG: hypothetical protein A3K10_05870 [Bacteroidetes bacterium RIFCSPLOWO2_12_FULL_31_6]|nr:MAG: hypothetical protein A3K10_05870 [Bacteroidetes bacterium RIFCSPLOWO2_12_FULL_31_6]